MYLTPIFVQRYRYFGLVASINGKTAISLDAEKKVLMGYLVYQIARLISPYAINVWSSCPKMQYSNIKFLQKKMAVLSIESESNHQVIKQKESRGVSLFSLL
jgi:hypothetical protein